MKDMDKKIKLDLLKELMSEMDELAIAPLKGKKAELEVSMIKLPKEEPEMEMEEDEMKDEGEELEDQEEIKDEDLKKQLSQHMSHDDEEMSAIREDLDKVAEDEEEEEDDLDSSFMKRLKQAKKLK